MAAESPPPGQYREQLDAEYVLAVMEEYADLAELWEAETCPELRRDFAEQYREIIGVPPERREELRTAMERIREGVRARVQDVRESLRSQPNGSGSVRG